MHDGTNPYDGVLEVVKKLKEEGKDVVILSNSSKRKDNTIKMLKKLGFDPTDFSQIITSGEVAYHLLSRSNTKSCPMAPQPWDVLEPALDNPEKRNVFCFGSGDGDEEYLNSCGWTLAKDMGKADLIVARGTFTIQDGSSVVQKSHDGEEAYFEAYGDKLIEAAQRKIPMIIANPDKVRPDAARSPMPGTIGNAYEKAMGGDDTIVKYIGKPFSDVYEIALRNKDRSRACMIGDALETDITGGSVEGIDTIWVVNDGVHNVEIQSKGNGSLEKGCAAVLEDFNKLESTYAKDRQLSPTIVMPHFRW